MNRRNILRNRIFFAIFLLNVFIVCMSFYVFCFPEKNHNSIKEINACEGNISKKTGHLL